ncbi:hypothetical protein, partial [Metamycoplasma hominis]
AVTSNNTASMQSAK